MGIRFQLYDLIGTVNRITNDPKTGVFLAETCARYMDQFIPMDTGMLAQNYVIEPFRVTYTQVYAHRQFNGNNFNFSKEKHPNATAHWDKATKKAFGKQIAIETENYIKSR